MVLKKVIKLNCQNALKAGGWCIDGIFRHSLTQNHHLHITRALLCWKHTAFDLGLNWTQSDPEMLVEWIVIGQHTSPGLLTALRSHVRPELTSLAGCVRITAAGCPTTGWPMPCCCTERCFAWVISVTGDYTKESSSLRQRRCSLINVLTQDQDRLKLTAESAKAPLLDHWSIEIGWDNTCFAFEQCQ
jgi:hypothetical protein